MADFAGTLTVGPRPLILTLSPSPDPNTTLTPSTGAVITLTLTRSTSDSFTLTFVPEESSGLTFEGPAQLSPSPILGVEIGSNLVDPSEVLLTVEVDNAIANITQPLSIPFQIPTNFGEHDPSIVIDPPPPP